MARAAAIEIQRELPAALRGCVDLAIYRLGGSLRLPNCCKISDIGIVDAESNYRLPAGAPLWQYMMTDVTDCVAIRTPLHLQRGTGIDPIYAEEDRAVTPAAVKLIKKWLKSHSIFGAL